MEIQQINTSFIWKDGVIHNMIQHYNGYTGHVSFHLVLVFIWYYTYMCIYIYDMATDDTIELMS